jgi:hypothetical protein
MVKRVFFVLAAAGLSAAGAAAQEDTADVLFDKLRVPPLSVQSEVTKGALETDIDRFIDVNGWDKMNLKGFFIYAGADAKPEDLAAKYLNLGFAYGFSSLYLAASVTKQDNMTLMVGHKTPGAFRLNMSISSNPAFGFEWGKGIRFASGGVLDLDFGTALRLSGDKDTGVGIKLGAMYHTKSQWDIGGYLIPYIGLGGSKTGLNFLFKSGKTIETDSLLIGVVPKISMCYGFGPLLDVSTDLGFKYRIKKTFGIYSGLSVSLFKFDLFGDAGLSWVSVAGDTLAIGVSIEPSKTFSLQAYVKNNFLYIQDNATAAIDLNDNTFLGNLTSWQAGIVVSCKVSKLSDLGDALD